MSWPTRFRKGAVDHSVVGAVDLFPTVLSLLGLNNTLDIQRGYDISALLTGKVSSPQQRPENRPLMWQWRSDILLLPSLFFFLTISAFSLFVYRYAISGPCWNDSPELAIRHSNYTLLMNPDNSRVELYYWGNISNPSTTHLFESQNLALDLPETVAILKSFLKQWHSDLKSGPTVEHVGCSGYNFPTEISLQENSTPIRDIVPEDDGMLML